jgi:hypothetical protein
VTIGAERPVKPSRVMDWAVTAVIAASGEPVAARGLRATGCDCAGASVVPFPFFEPQRWRLHETRQANCAEA